MSKRIEAKITCPNCCNQFAYTLYRSIWGEYPENRELVMSDRINLATCPSCNRETKLPFPFIYTNVKQFFAVWWEPEFDPQIDKDTEAYKKMLGEGNYLATAPRIKDWNEFKNTILKFERGELQGKAGTFRRQVQVQDKKKGGCLGIAILLVAATTSLAYGISKF